MYLLQAVEASLDVPLPTAASPEAGACEPLADLHNPNSLRAALSSYPEISQMLPISG